MPLDGIVDRPRPPLLRKKETEGATTHLENGIELTYIVFNDIVEILDRTLNLQEEVRAWQNSSTCAVYPESHSVDWSL